MKDLNDILQKFLKDSVTDGKEQPLIRQGIRGLAISEIREWALEMVGESYPPIEGRDPYSEAWKDGANDAKHEIRQRINKSIEK